MHKYIVSWQSANFLLKTQVAGGLLERIQVKVDDMLSTMSATWLDNSPNKPPWSPNFTEKE